MDCNFYSFSLLVNSTTNLQCVCMCICFRLIRRVFLNDKFPNMIYIVLQTADRNLKFQSLV